MTNIRKLLIALAFASLTPASAQSISPVLRIEGPITVESLEAPILTLGALAPKQEVVLVLNSPGGDLDATEKFIEALGDRPKTCIVDSFVASAAYYLLLHCDKRYYLPSSQIIFHWIVLMYSSAPSSETVTKDYIELVYLQGAWDRFGRHILGMSQPLYLLVRNRERPMRIDTLTTLSKNKWIEPMSPEDFKRLTGGNPQ